MWRPCSRAAPPGEVFAPVAAEIGLLPSADVTALVGYDQGGVVTVLGAWSGTGAAVPSSGTASKERP